MTAGTVKEGRFSPEASEAFLVDAAGSYRVSARKLSHAGNALPLSFGWLSTPFGRVQAALDAPLRTGSVLWTVPDPSDPALVLHDMAAGQPYMSRSFPADLPFSRSAATCASCSNSALLTCGKSSSTAGSAG